MRLSREQLRSRVAELRALVGDHDPFGLLAAGAPVDEYDEIVGPLLRQLEHGADAAAISAWLESEVANQYGLAAMQPADLAAAAVAWYASSWPASGPVPSDDCGSGAA